MLSQIKVDIHLLLLPGVGELEFHLRVGLCVFLWFIKPAVKNLLTILFCGKLIYLFDSQSCRDFCATDDLSLKRPETRRFALSDDTNRNALRCPL